MRERGARVTHNSPIEPGGPREWLARLLMAFWTDLGQGFRRTYPEFSTNVSLQDQVTGG